MTPREPDRYPKCKRCLDRGIYDSPWVMGQIYCDCPAGEEAKETGCLDLDDGPQPADFGDQ